MRPYALLPLVSVAIPTRNRLRYLKEAIGSVRAQTYPNWELIVVDDASEDDTRPWLSSVADPRIRTISLSQHSERSEARNCGLVESRGEFVHFLDDDDRLLPRALERLMRAISRHSSAIAAVGARIEFDSHGNRRRQIGHPRVPVERFGWTDIVLGWCPGTGQALVRRSRLVEAGGWNNEMVFAEDHELWLRLSRLGTVALIPQAVLEYRIHACQYRPSQVGNSEEPFRSRAVKALSGKRRAHAERLLAARRALWKAEDAYAARRGAEALRAYGRVLRMSPELRTSPLLGPAVWASLAKSTVMIAVGGRWFEWIRWLKGRARSGAGRELGRPPHSGVESDVREVDHHPPGAE
jgi:glycosyltransferase involved in cell wall biosynthesis